jgi:hypothetical protein
MNIANMDKLSPKERERVKAKMTKRERADTLQPNDPHTGKKNAQFVRLYGDVDKRKVEVGSAQQGIADEISDKQNWELRKRMDKLTSKTY